MRQHDVREVCNEKCFDALLPADLDICELQVHLMASTAQDEKHNLATLFEPAKPVLKNIPQLFTIEHSRCHTYQTKR